MLVLQEEEVKEWHLLDLRLHGPLDRTRGTLSMRKEEVKEWHLGCGWEGGCAAC